MLRCFSSWRGGAILAAAILVGGYLVIWHQQHIAGILPFAVLFACPLMHLFMHRGHGAHGHSHGQGALPERGKDKLP